MLDTRHQAQQVFDFISYNYYSLLKTHQDSKQQRNLKGQRSQRGKNKEDKGPAQYKCVLTVNSAGNGDKISEYNSKTS